MLDRGVHHSVAEHVQTELRLARDDVLLVVGGCLLTHEAPCALRLEHEALCLRHGELRRGRYERAQREGWKTYEIDASHNPHITNPRALLAILNEIASA